jgi:hypothetical protein
MGYPARDETRKGYAFKRFDYPLGEYYLEGRRGFSENGHARDQKNRQSVFMHPTTLREFLPERLYQVIYGRGISFLRGRISCPAERGKGPDVL